MKFWKDNKLSLEYELTDQEILDKFKVWCKKKDWEELEYMGITKALPYFIGSQEGLHSVVENADLTKFIKDNWELLKKIVYKKNEFSL